jgi:Spy/CpxP family protein refolding chaperone
MTSLAEAGRGAGRRGRLVWIALALSLTLNICFVGGALWLRMHAAPGMLPPAERFRQLGEQLDLDKTQQAAFEQFLRTMRQNSHAFRESNEPVSTQIWSELAKPDPEQAAINQLIDKATENRRTYQKETSQALGSFMQSLTPEQRARLGELARRHHDPAAQRIWRMLLP